jgi:integrase
MSTPLTDTRIRALPHPASGQVDVADSRSPGLFLRVSATSKRWLFRFTCPNTGKRSRVALAKYPDLGLAAARERADRLRGMIAKGQNPVERKARERVEAPQRTFGALAERYLNEHAKRFKKSADADDRNLRLHVLPRWGERSYASINRGDIIALIEQLIADDKPVLANRVTALVSKVFAFAVDVGLLDHSPATRLRKRAKESAKTRTLDDAEIRLFWSRIMSPPVSPAIGLALRLSLLTGLRAGEVARIHRKEIIDITDTEKAALLIGGERTKNARAHLMPLSATARRIVLDALELAGDRSDYLFPNRVNDEEATDPHTLSKAMSRFAADLADDASGAATWKANAPTPHDLRRSFATKLSSLGIAKEVRDALMNHAATDIGSRVYDQYQKLPEKRHAVNLWATALSAILEGKGSDAKVVRLRRPAS